MPNLTDVILSGQKQCAARHRRSVEAEPQLENRDAQEFLAVPLPATLSNSSKPEGSFKKKIGVSGTGIGDGATRTKASAVSQSGS